MLNKLKTSYYKFGAAVTVGLMTATDAQAANNFNNIAGNIVGSISSLPALISAMAYLFGVLLIVLGILKIKDHVENPSQTPLKDGAIRLCIGGALFALPIVLEAAFETIGTGTAAKTAKLNAVDFAVIP